MKKTIAGLGLVLVGLAAVLALFSFWRENWGANQTPGAVEQLLARFFLSGARRAESEIPNPVPATEENLRAGRELYERQCAFCHGLDGAGPGESKVQFYPPVPSLSPPENPLTDAQMHFVIRRGIRYTAMPSFEKALSEQDVWKVVLWLRRLESDPAGRQPLAQPESVP